VLSCTARDEEDGFPGNLEVQLTYEWTGARTFKISYRAVTDKTTLVNLSNHIYFNLNGEGAGTILDHELCVHADHMIPLDSRMIPTGSMEPVEDGPFDFRQPQTIGSRINLKHEQLTNAAGYDHNFILTEREPGLSLRSPLSGISMQIATDRPCIRIFSGNNLDSSRSGKSGRPYPYRSGLVMAPQAFPDAVHHPQFPTVIVRPGEVYHSASEYRFTSS
jgi:aldose 1-epimerase